MTRYLIEWYEKREGHFEVDAPSKEAAIAEFEAMTAVEVNRTVKREDCEAYAFEV
jgi:hypothetical protein